MEGADSVGLLGLLGERVEGIRDWVVGPKRNWAKEGVGLVEVVGFGVEWVVFVFFGWASDRVGKGLIFCGFTGGGWPIEMFNP